MFKGKGLRQGGGLERDIWDRFQNLENCKKPVIQLGAISKIKLII